MAISRIKYGGVRGKALNYSEFLCDGIEDLENLPTNIKKTDDFPTCAIGSRAFIGDNTYTLFPSQEWKPTKLVVCDCGCIHGVDSDSESEEGGNTDEPTTEDTTADIIDGSITSITDEKVTSVRAGAFSFCINLTGVNLPNATSIGTNAFYDCTSLINISLPNATSIGDGAFSGCTSLTNINLPNATSIGRGIFSSLSGSSPITTIKLPSATTIAEHAFDGCTNLTDLYLPGTKASYTNAPFGLNTETCTIHYEYDFTEDEGESNTETPPEQQDNG